MSETEAGPEKQIIVWLDLETGGLEPDAHQILEVAAVATVGERFDEVSRLELCIRPYRVGGILTHIGEWAKEQHTKSGLLDVCLREGVSELAAERMLLDFLDRLPASPLPLYLGGSSVHFDLGFLRRRMPQAAKRFSHRVADVSAVQLLTNVANGRDAKHGFSGSDSKHRAMDDILWSLEMAKCLCRKEVIQ